MRTSYLVLFTMLLASQVYGNLLDGLEHHHGDHGDHHHGDEAHGEHAHGEHAHGDHGEHAEGEHAHGDHAHGEHAEGDHAHGEHAEGDHAHGEHAEGDHAHGEHAQGDHAHGEHAHGDHAAGDHAENAHGDEHNHDHVENIAVNQDSFASALASDLGGGFLSSLPANPAPAPAETFVAPGPAPAEIFVAPSTEAAETFVTFAPAVNFGVPLVEEQQYVEQNSIQFPEEEVQFSASSSSSAGEAKQLSTSNASGRGSNGEYPEYAVVPRTSFSCAAQETGGYFADPEADCQVFHICLNGQNLGSFLCPNGTLFHQQYFVCDWWFNVDCGSAFESYGLNARIGVVPESE